MTTFIVRRLVQLLFVLWGTVTLMFFLFFLLPDDPANIIAGGGNRPVPEATLKLVRHKYGLDRPILVQYGKYLGRVATFDFGESYRDRTPVSDIIKAKAPASLRLAIWAMLIESSFGILAGILSSKRKNSLADTTTTLVAAIASAIPVFVLANFFQQLTGVYAHTHNWPEWAQFPVQGIGPNSWFAGFIPAGAQFEYTLQPAIVLASVSAIIVARLTRTQMLEVDKSDYIRTARAKGLRERDITFRHALRNAMIPVITFIGIDFGTIVGAAILTEYSFNWPGLGSKIVSAADGRDLPVMVGLTVVVVLVYGIVNMAVDISYAWFDPRVRLGESAQ